MHGLGRVIIVDPRRELVGRVEVAYHLSLHVHLLGVHSGGLGHPDLGWVQLVRLVGVVLRGVVPVVLRRLHLFFLITLNLIVGFLT